MRYWGWGSEWGRYVGLPQPILSTNIEVLGLGLGLEQPWAVTRGFRVFAGRRLFDCNSLANVKLYE